MCGPALAAEPLEPLPTFEETCFQGRPQGGNLSLADAQRLLECIGPGSELRLGDQGKVFAKGLLRIRDWSVDNVLRMNVAHQGQSLRLYVWGEGQGVVILLRPAGAAYRITERPEELHSKQDFRSALGALVATDDRRDMRLPAGAYQVRCQDGAVVVTKGDVRLITVPLEGPAKAIYVQVPGGSALSDLALERAGPVPDDPPPAHHVVLDGARPADLPWQEKLPDGAHFHKLDDGRVELTAEKTSEVALATVAVPGPGLYEIILQIDDATPGSGLSLLDGKGEPLDGIAFGLAHKKRLAFGFATYRETPWLDNDDFERKPVAFAGPGQWLRLVVAGGASKCWISGDGLHWGQVLDCRDRIGAWQSIALYAREPAEPNKAEVPLRRIRLRRLQVRELDGLLAAAPGDLLAKAAGADVALKLDKGETVEAWRQRIALAAPAVAPPAAWRFACTLRALAAPISIDAAESLLYRGVSERFEELPTVEDKIRLMQDAALLWRYHDYDTQRQLELWDRLGRQVLTAGTPADFEQFLRAYMQTPFGDAPERSGPVSWDLARDAMFLFYAEHRVAALSRMVNMVNFWRANDQQVGGWPVAQQIDRMLGLLNVRPLGKAARKSRRATYVADALSPPVSRAADGILSELQSALDAKQYADAARILAGSNPPREGGLVPAPDDDQLFVSFHVALRMLMRGHDGFRDAMNRQVGPADELKIDQCLGRGDPAAVQVLPLQYYGTPAAAPPCQWLGDRALSAADPAEAIHWYDEALRVAAPLQQAELAARKRLASAMLGKLQGQPPSQAVSLGGAKVPPEQFEGWVKEQLARSRGGAEASSSAEPAAALTVARPATVEAVSLGQWNENAGRGFRREEMPWEFYDVDWTWRHLSLRAEADGLFVFHRSRIAAFEPGGEKPRWSCNLGNAWSPAPLCPVFTAQRIYLCAALAPEWCGVACLDRKTGRRLWLCDCDGTPVSDPLWRPGNTGYPGRLFVLAVGRGQRQPSAPLTLVELDPENGDIVARQPIIEMTEHANLPGQCQAVAAGHRLVVLVAGNVLCADFQGRLLWLRQRVTLPCQVDAAVPLQAMQPAIARGERLFLQQPGSCVVDCLDAETGERHWRRGIVGLRSISELQGDRLLARTDWGLVAVSQETGEVAWQRAVPGLFAIDARTTSGLVLAARQVVNGDKPQVAFLWIDGATGRSRGESSIPLTDNRPARFGPIAVRGDHAWTAYGYGPKDDSPTAENNKRIVELRFGKPIAE